MQDLYRTAELPADGGRHRDGTKRLGGDEAERFELSLTHLETRNSGDRSYQAISSRA